jgi:hypothetical protein
MATRLFFRRCTVKYSITLRAPTTPIGIHTRLAKLQTLEWPWRICGRLPGQFSTHVQRPSRHHSRRSPKPRSRFLTPRSSREGTLLAMPWNEPIEAFVFLRMLRWWGLGKRRFGVFRSKEVLVLAVWMIGDGCRELMVSVFPFCASIESVCAGRSFDRMGGA